MVALGEEVDVQLAENRGKTIDVVEFMFNAAARYSQPIAEGFFAIGNGGNKEAFRVGSDAFRCDFACRQIDDRHLLSTRQHCPDAYSARGSVHSEKRERITAPGRNDRLDLRLTLPQHAQPPPSWPRCRGRRSAGCRPSRDG